MEQSKQDPKDTVPADAEENEKSLSDSDSHVREGQEDSSILDEKRDPGQKPLTLENEKVAGSTGQEEFIDDEANTLKKEE